jgi:hypothetical protein
MRDDFSTDSGRESNRILSADEVSLTFRFSPVPSSCIKPKLWIQWCVNHHIEKVVEQLAAT